MSAGHEDARSVVRPGLVEGEIILVSGAASGIGRATAELAAAEGVGGLVLTDRDADGLSSLEAELKDLGVGVVTVAGEMTDTTLADRLVQVAVESFGRLDAAVNNAGVRGELVSIADSTDELFDQVIDINLRAVYRCLRAQLRQMGSQGRGSVVNVASATIFGASAGLGAYAASKNGVIGLSKVASKEAGRTGVRVNVVCPGRTDTPLFRSHAGGDSPLDAAALVAAIPLGRFAQPLELAQAILFLCCDRSSFVNGSTLIVDGGRTG